MATWGPVGPRKIIYCRNTASMLGDSINAYGTNNTASGYPAYYRNGPISWINDALSLSGCGLDVLGFEAYPGQPLAALMSSVNGQPAQIPAAIADPTDIAHVHIGINDLNYTIGNNPLSAMFPLAQAGIAALAANKKLVTWDSVNPVSQSGSTGAKGRAYLIPTWNAMIRKECSKYPNVFFVDNYGVMVDPTSSALNPLANMVRTDDGIHYVSNGAYTVAKNWIATVMPWVVLTKYKTPGTNLCPAWSTTNSSGTTTNGSGGTTTPNSGTITGTMPTGYNCAVASGSAAVTITALAPDMQVFACTNSGGSDSVVRITLTSTSAILAAAAAGATIQAGFGYQTWGNSSGGLKRLCCTLQFNGGTPIIYGCGEDDTDEPTITFPSVAFGGQVITPPYTVPATESSLTMDMDIKVAAGGSVNVAIFNPFFNVLT